MKTPGLKKWKRALFKSMLALACFVHFTPQLSSKFYLYASSSPAAIRLRKASTALREPNSLTQAKTGLTTTASSNFSIDKRYNLKHVFALLPVLAALPCRDNDQQPLTTLAIPGSIVRRSFTPSLRGPPPSPSPRASALI